MSEFKSKEELKKFVLRHTTIAIEPIRKSRYVLVNPFSSANAMKIVIDTLVNNLWIKLNQK